MNDQYDKNGRPYIAPKQMVEDAQKRVDLKRKIRRKLGHFIDLNKYDLKELNFINNKL